MKNKIIAITINITILIVWFLLWGIASYLLRKTFPALAFAPIIGFPEILKADSWTGHIFSQVTFPWLIFWSVYVLFIYVKRNKNR